MGCATEAARQQGQASRPTRHRGRGTDSPQYGVGDRKPEVLALPTVPRENSNRLCEPCPASFTHNALYLFNATVAINPLLSLPIMPSACPSPHSRPASLQHLSLAHSFLSHYPACLRPIHFRFISILLPVAHLCLLTSVVLLALLSLTIMFWVHCPSGLRPLSVHYSSLCLLFIQIHNASCPELLLHYP